MSSFDRHHEASAVVGGAVEKVFSYVDDPARLSSHREKSSWVRGGGSMKLDLDEGKGRAIGSRIRLAGRELGIELFLDEVVVERDAPRRKVWQTTGTPKLLVIGQDRMGFELSPRGDASLLRVFIDYALPEAGWSRWLGRLLGRSYARWCTRRMVDDAVLFFGG